MLSPGQEGTGTLGRPPTSSAPSKGHVVCILQLSNLWGTEVHDAPKKSLMDSHRGKLLLQGKLRQCMTVRKIASSPTTNDPAPNHPECPGSLASGEG